MMNECLKLVRQRLLNSMVDYMDLDEDDSESNSDYGYTRADVDQCVAIVDSYVTSLQNVANSDQFALMNLIQNVTEELNKLNEHCDGCLIETDQREDLCELILTTAKKCGLKSDDDVTEQWREW